MSDSILVTGGTGTLGRHVVGRLLEAGADVRVLSRSPRPGMPYASVKGDLTTGAGLERAVGGVSTVVHLASDPRRPRGDVEGTRRLAEAARAAGAGHLVFISIVGVDRHPYSYYRAKYEAERVVAASGLPHTILRTTQFHDFVLLLARSLVRLPVVPVPAGWRFQPVDTSEVAERLAALASAAPAGRVPDMGGPEILPARDLVRAYLSATGRRRPLMSVRVPGKTAAAFRQGVHLAPGQATGVRTFAEFLAGRGTPERPVSGRGAA
ncbi:SDR family oxidoreductase [Microbispora catharanthi]|uniref:NAD(P)H-binding protein n=1 Tax=Microbispora catharanthi TaxID=1712871 RepID=A0A5N6BRP5_9ACTN|nr:SDR family oxidoreductase [Microbispora catharanthi]KAB8183124.1 NAD(P)H-binding protein [Microbispora catharanthi]